VKIIIGFTERQRSKNKAVTIKRLESDSNAHVCIAIHSDEKSFVLIATKAIPKIMRTISFFMGDNLGGYHNNRNSFYDNPLNPLKPTFSMNYAYSYIIPYPL
jgi:hypothetical protein